VGGIYFFAEIAITASFQFILGDMPKQFYRIVVVPFPEQRRELLKNLFCFCIPGPPEISCEFVKRDYFFLHNGL